MILAFQFEEFIYNNHIYTNLIDDDYHFSIQDVIKNNFRFLLINKEISSTREARFRIKLNSIKTPF